MENYRLYNDCCLNLPNHLHDEKVDFVFADIPYGITKNKWDSVIPLEKMWSMLEQVCNPNTAIALMAQTPFDKVLGASNINMLRYEWIWEKTEATGFLNSKKMPLRAHENILIFYKKLPAYNPQFTHGHPKKSTKRINIGSSNYGTGSNEVQEYCSTSRYPRTVITFAKDKQKLALHPTQKPVSLAEYLINTYTQPGQTVLDFTMGSGTTDVACANTGRRFVGCEIENDIFDTADQRISRAFI